MDVSVGVEETRPLLQDRERAGKMKRKPTPLPKLQIGILMLLQFAEPLTALCIYPFINQLVSELDITGGDEKLVGYYAGMIESTFFATEALFVFQWSRISDHIGRKPVLLVGVGGLCISMICFGLSKTFSTLVVSRSLAGLLNGNIGVIKSMIGDLTDSTNAARGFACIPVSWSMGATIGATIGGQLARPHDRWPRVFSHTFWIRFPYFLPCAVSAGFSAFIFVITALFLKETVERRKAIDRASHLIQTPLERGDAPLPIRTVLTRPVVISIANYGAVVLSEIALSSLMPIFFSMPIEIGGLGLEPSTIGIILGPPRLLGGFSQVIFFAKAVETFGPKRVFQAGFATLVPVCILFPVMNLYAKVHGVSPVVWAMVAIQQSVFCMMTMSFGAANVFVTSSAPHKRSLGAVNGAAQFIASVARAIGPASSTSLFSASLERGWLGGYAVYAILITTSILLLFPSTLLPSEAWLKEDERRDER